MPNEDSFIPYDKLDEEKRRLVDSTSGTDREYAAAMGWGLNRLVTDELSEVRLYVARHGYGLDRLLADNDPDVRRAANEALEKSQGNPGGAFLSDWIDANPEKCALPWNRAADPDRAPYVDARGRLVLATYHRPSGVAMTVLFNPDSQHHPYIRAYGYNINDGTWSQGRYFDNLLDAVLAADPDVVEEATTVTTRRDIAAELERNGVEATDENIERAIDEVSLLKEHAERSFVEDIAYLSRELVTQSTFQVDYPEAGISTEYACESVEELVEWVNDEFAEELGGKAVGRGDLAIEAVSGLLARSGGALLQPSGMGAGREVGGGRVGRAEAPPKSEAAPPSSPGRDEHGARGRAKAAPGTLMKPAKQGNHSK